MLLKSINFSRLDIKFRLNLFKSVIRRLKKIQLIILNQINELSFAKFVDLDHFN
jgi:hypothetical protein